MGTDSVSSHQKDQERGRLIKPTKEMFLLLNMVAYKKEVCIPDGRGEESLGFFLVTRAAYSPPKSLLAGGLL